MKKYVYKTIKFLGLIIYKLLFMPKVIGKENIPTTGGVIIASNHISKLDAATMVGVPNRLVYILAKKELFDTKIGNWFYTSMGCIKVDRASHNDNVNEDVYNLLSKGNVIGIFPEGTTNKTDDIILPFKYGAVTFAKNSKVPIVPMAITGKYRKFKRGLRIEFGKPIYITGEIANENDKLMNIIKSMIIKGRENEKK